MEVRTRRLAHGLLFIVGLVLIVAGIATGKYGALIVGLIVSAVNLRQWQQRNKHRSAADQAR